MDPGGIRDVASIGRDDWWRGEMTESQRVQKASQVFTWAIRLTGAIHQNSKHRGKGKLHREEWWVQLWNTIQLLGKIAKFLFPGCAYSIDECQFGEAQRFSLFQKPLILCQQVTENVTAIRFPATGLARSGTLKQLTFAPSPFLEKNFSSIYQNIVVSKLNIQTYLK